jgi:hypothetical protein
MTISCTANSNARTLPTPTIRSFVNTISARRHLAWGWADTGHRRLKYEIEGDRLALLIEDALAFIKYRDGAEVLKQVSDDLLAELLKSIQHLRGGLPPSWRGLLKELIADRQAADAKIDAQLKQRGRRGDSTKAIAA